MQKGFQIIGKARSKAQEDTVYLPLDYYSLRMEKCLKTGSGSPQEPYQLQITIYNDADTSWEGIIRLELHVPKTDPRFFLPGFLYGRNRGEAPMFVANEFPRLRTGEPIRPASSWWMMRSDRLSHPAAFIYDHHRLQGFCTKPYFQSDGNHQYQSFAGDGRIHQYGGFYCSLEEEDGCCSVGYTLGYENAPWMFVQSHTVLERAPLQEGCFCLQAGEQVTVLLECFDYEAENELSLHTAIRSVYQKYHAAPRKINDVNTAIRQLSGAVRDAAWLPEEHSYAGFVRIDPKGSYRYNRIFSLSWTNGFAVAVPMLMAANTLGDERMRAQALDCMQYILENCMNPSSGLPYDAYDNGEWSLRGWWFDGMHSGGHSSYLCGQFLYYLLKAYENEKKTRNICHEDWLTYAKPVLQRLQSERNRQGEYPFSFSEQDGTGLEYDSFGGTWCLAAAAYYVRLTGDTLWLEELKESEAHYHRKFVQHAECYGAPLDTDKAVDSEGILAYIRACRALHEITSELVYLQHMRDGLDYEFTFKFCYNVPIQVPPLSEVGWSSCGGSITSVCNPHIHPMSSSIVGEMKYYVEQTGEAYVKSRMEDTILWGCQTYNTYDGEYGYGLTGWMSERFCYSEGLLVETYADGRKASTWFALMPWASCSVLEGLCDSVK